MAVERCYFVISSNYIGEVGLKKVVYDWHLWTGTKKGLAISVAYLASAEKENDLSLRDGDIFGK